MISKLYSTSGTTWKDKLRSLSQGHVNVSVKFNQMVLFDFILMWKTNHLFGQVMIWKMILFFLIVMNLADVKANECISLYKLFSSEDISYDKHIQEK